MKAFKFYILAEDYTYNIMLEDKIIDDELYVVTSSLRHPTFVPEEGVYDGIGRFGDKHQYILSDEFQKSVESFSFYISGKLKPVTIELLYDSLINECEKYIQQNGSLYFHEMLKYVDIFILIVKAIYDVDINDYHTTYQKAVQLILSQYPHQIYFKDLLRGKYTWADIMK